jgi:hypothetical protein
MRHYRAPGSQAVLQFEANFKNGCLHGEDTSMKFMRKRWVPIAWVDALAKRLAGFVFALVTTYAVLRLLMLVIGDDGDPGYKTKKGLIYIVLVMAIWIIVTAVKLVVLPIRSAITGKFLDEYAQDKADRTSGGLGNNVPATAPH